MKIAIVGTGAVGGYLGARLALAGEDVVCIDRGEQLAAIRADGLRLIEADGSEHHAARIKAVSLAEAGPQDVILLAVKAYQIRDVLPAMRALFHADTAVVTLQNGIPWWYFQGLAGPWQGRALETVDAGGGIAAGIEFARVIGAVVYPASVRLAPGVIKVIEGRRFTLGEPDGSRSPRLEALAQVLSGAGFEAPLTTDIRSEIWLKLWGNLSFNPISALTRATMVDICRFPPTRELTADMMREAQAIGEKLGARFRVPLEKRIAGAERVGAHKTSMLQDVEAGCELELEALVGSVRELGRLTGTPTPTIDAVYACTSLLAKTLDERNGKPAIAAR
jgi:2-dehydropantoate 2-reductase